jgi:hypothetical protein
MRTPLALCIVLLAGFAAAAAGCSRNEEDANAARFDGERALGLVEAQLAMGPRVPGTEAHHEVVDWIVTSLQEAGWEADIQPFTGQGQAGTNILGRFGEGAGTPLLLGAHYDSRPVADHDALSPQSPVPGANDGASGVAVLLELARVLPEDGLTRPLWLAFFDLEDGGGAAGSDWILGSRAFAAQLPSAPAAAIVVDMIGDADLQIYFEINSDPLLRESIWSTAASLGFDAFVPAPLHAMLDDHIPFVENGIPSVLIIDFDYPYYHTTQDTLDKVSAHSLEQVGQTLEAWLLSQQ